MTPDTPEFKLVREVVTRETAGPSSIPEKEQDLSNLVVALPENMAVYYATMYNSKYVRTSLVVAGCRSYYY